MTTATEKVVPAGTEKTTDKTVPEKRRALGRGLESLLPGPRVVTGIPGTRAGWPTAAATVAIPAAGNDADAGGAPAPHDLAPDEHAPEPAVIPEIHAQAARAMAGEVMEIPLSQIDPNPYQTRVFFDEDLMEELEDSIRATGVVQPIVVRPGKDGRYTLVLGERRCRASKKAGKTAIPAIVRRVSEQQAAEMTVVENLQRQDLNCMEQAMAFSKLSQNFQLTQGEIGERVGLSRESVANYMRLLKLPGKVMQYLQDGMLGFSEAKELLRLDDYETITKVADEAVAKHWRLWHLEDVVMDIRIKNDLLPQPKQPGQARWQDPNVRAAARELERILGVKVRISDRKGKGTIRIEYATLADYDRVVGMLRGKK